MDANTLEFYKGLYENELHRKEEINSKVSNYITILTILGTIIVFSLKNFADTFFVVPVLLISLITFIVNIVIFWIANHNKKYQYFDEAVALRQQFSLIDDFYNNEGNVYVTADNTVEKLSQEEKNRQLKEFYIKYSSENKKINDRRVTWNLLFMKSVTISLIIVGIIGLFAIFFEKPVDVNIMNEKIETYEKGGKTDVRFKKRK